MTADDPGPLVGSVTIVIDESRQWICEDACLHEGYAMLKRKCRARLPAMSKDRYAGEFSLSRLTKPRPRGTIRTQPQEEARWPI